MIDDLRVYGKSLDANESAEIYGNGGGDFNRLKVIGAGLTKITALQKVMLHTHRQIRWIIIYGS